MVRRSGWCAMIDVGHEEGGAMADEIGLADAVAALRGELERAMAASKGEQVRFRLGTVEMEFTVEVTTEGKGAAGVRFFVFSADAGGSRARATAHRVKLQLQPWGPQGDIDITDDSVVAPPAIVVPGGTAP